MEIQPANTTTYIFTVEDGCGSTANDNVNINVHSVPEVNIVSDISSGCEPLEVHFTEMNNCHNCSYIWTLDNNSRSTVLSGQNIIHSFNDDGIYDISLTVTNEHGCDNSITREDMISVLATPEADFIADPPITTILTPEIYFYNASNGAYNYQWSFGNEHNSTLENPLNKYDKIGKYEVELIAISETGCADTTYKEILIELKNTFHAPTAFSPDGDGTNDYFKIFGTGIHKDNFLLMVYDRWGNKIFESEDISRSWDGKVNGSSDIAQSGTYTWLCLYVNINGTAHEKSGPITLIR